MADTLAQHLAWSTAQQGSDLPDLATVVGRPEWMRDALCQERPTTGFFPERGEHGVWGGTSNRERLRLRAAHRAA